MSVLTLQSGAVTSGEHHCRLFAAQKIANVRSAAVKRTRMGRAGELSWKWPI